MAYWNYGYSTNHALKYYLKNLQQRNRSMDIHKNDQDFKGFDIEYFKANRNDIIAFILSFCKNSELRNVMEKMLDVISLKNVKYCSNLYRFIYDCVCSLELSTGRTIKDNVKIESIGGYVKMQSVQQQNLKC